MFKKLRDKITEEVQQTSLRLPVSVQQSVQQLTQLSPFSGTATSPGEQKRELETRPLQDELLVDISDIRPAGHNKDLFSIDEDSHESSPSKSGFQLVDLSDAETISSADLGNGLLQGQGVAGVTFDPTITVTSSPAHRARRDSAGSCVSDASSLFPIYEVPGVSFNIPQSDLESSSEWEDGGSTAVMERLSKDTVYQAYLKMRQRYHKYKGRYADLARAYKDKERESDKLRDVLTKTQDKALRKVSELKEQCALEQQAKAHLEQELRSDLEEKDHKIAALQTKVSGLREQCVLQQQAKAHLEEELNADLEERELKISALMTKVKILQEGVTGDLNSTVEPSQNNDQSIGTQQDDRLIKSQEEADSVSASDNSSGMDNVSTTESASLADNISMADSVSVTSHGSASTAVTVNVEAEELIEKLKGDVAKHKSLLARCMDNIRGNKERIAVLTQERDVATAQLQDKLKQIETLKEEHLKELDSLRSSMESSAISMAETKKQLFEELQAKEAETERCKQVTATLERQLEEEREQWQEELQMKQQELEEKEAAVEELGTTAAATEDNEEDQEASVTAMKEEIEAKIQQLEAQTIELKDSKTRLETQLMEISLMNTQLEEKAQNLMKDKDELRGKVKIMEDDKQEMEKKLMTLESVKVELEGKVMDLQNASVKHEEQVKELTESKQLREEKLQEAEKSWDELQEQMQQLQLLHSEFVDSAMATSQESKALKEANGKLTQNLEVIQKEKVGLKTSFEEIEKEKEDALKKLNQKNKTLMELQEMNNNLELKLEMIMEENSRANNEVESANSEKELLCKQLDETRTEMEKAINSINEEIKCVKSEKEKIAKELQETKLDKEDINQRLLTLEKENGMLKSENEKLESEVTVFKENITLVNQQTSAELTSVREKMDKLNNDWEKQMKEKDVINAELSKKVSGLDQSLKSKTDEFKTKIDDYKQQMETLNCQLQKKEKREKEYEVVVESLEEEKKKLNENIGGLKKDLQDKETEYQSFLMNKEKGIDELRVRVAELEADVSSREVELTASVEEKKRLNAFLKKMKLEKAELQDELHATHGELTRLKEDECIGQKKIKDKDKENEKLKEEVTAHAEDNKRIREEMQRVSGLLETEMGKARDSYANLKGSYETYRKEKESMLSEQSKKITLLENKDANNEQQLCKLQSVVKQRDEKIEKLLQEKMTILDEWEKKVEELEAELDNKNSLLRKRTTDFESNLEELQMQMHKNEEGLRKQLESNFEEKHDLEKKVAELSHAAIEKDEEILRQANDADQRITNAHEDFSKKIKELENMWEQRLRSHGFADSLSAKSRYIALFNMIKISCELDKLQKQHEENLASTSMELSKSQQSQLDSARSSHQRAFASRDGTIAALKDEVDQLRLSHQEELVTWHLKCENLQSQLADARSQSECQSERLRVVETNMEESSVQLAASEAGSAGQEEGLQQASATCKALTAQVEVLTKSNEQLRKELENFEKEKEGTNKTIAMLEFNNEHNKNKVLNMELSNKDLQEKIGKLCKDKEKLVRQIREGSSGIYEDLLQEKEEAESSLTKEKEELECRLMREKEELQQRLSKEKEELEQRLTKEKDDLIQKHIVENKTLHEQVEGLMEIRSGYEKQISQIELNNAEMHGKIGGVQQERDVAVSEAAELRIQNHDLDKKLRDLSKVKVNLDEQVVVLKGTISSLEVKLESEENQVQTLGETINTLQNNILNLQKQVEGLNETCAKLARDLESESKLRIDTQAQLTQVKQMHKQLEETHSADRVTIGKLEKEKEELASSVASLSVARVKALELQARVTELESDKRTLSEKLSIIPDTIDSPNDKVNIVVEQLSEKTQTNTDEQRNQDEEVTSLKAVLKTKDEEVSRIRQSLKDVQERLRIAEVISGEVEEQQTKLRELEAKMAVAEEQHQQQIKTLMLEAERRVTAKEQECHQTISSAYDQQDNETSALVRQHRDVLREAQEEVREKAAALDSIVEDYQTKLKEKDEELCKFVQQYEEQLASLNTQHEVHIKEVEAMWKARAEKMVQHRESQLQEEMDGLTQEWNKERRELERLTQVAASAFRSGTESVELLKKQVAAQRRELEEVKMNHGKEVGELKALLELKRRTRGSGGAGSGVRLGMPLEEAAEFEYLKNVLYQYMLGKETQTLSKVLCAVVKFDSNQQQEILEHEEQRRSLQLETVASTVPPELLENERSDPSKTL